MRKLMFIVVVFMICSCGKKDHQNPELQVCTDTVCVLKENKYLVGGKPNDLIVLNDSLMAILYGKDLVVYNLEGEQIDKVGKHGIGPQEYISPQCMYYDGGNLYLWCATTLKLLKYDHFGNFISATPALKMAIKDFAIYNDRFACLYHGRGIDGRMITIYDMELEKEIKVIKNERDGDDILYIARHSGGICLIDSILYYAYPDKIQLYSYNLKNGKSSATTAFSDSDFIISEDIPDKDVVYNNFSLVTDYLNNNSIVRQVFSNGQNPVLLAETGMFENANNEWSNKKRKLRYYIFNGETIENSGAMSYPERCALIKGIDGFVYTSVGDFENDSIRVILQKMSLSGITDNPEF